MKRLLPAMMLRSNFMAASAASGASKVTMAAPAIEVSGRSLVKNPCDINRAFVAVVFGCIWLM